MSEPIKFTDAEKAAFRKVYAPQANDEQWLLFISECERRALTPGTHVVFQLRDAKEWSESLRQKITVKKVTLITTINALRLIADRSGKYEGHAPFTYYYAEGDEPLIETKIPRGRVPHAVSVEGYRAGWRVPLFAVARYDAYVQTFKDGGKDTPTRMWTIRGEEQLAKCAEALMLRTVTPEECGGLYIAEEMGGKVADDTVDEKPTPSSEPVPTATVAPAVNQEPAKVETTDKDNGAISEVITKPVQTTPFANIPPVDPALAAALEADKKRSETPATIPTNRLPAEHAEYKDPINVQQEVADRVARDKDPKPTVTGTTGANAGVTVVQEKPETLTVGEQKPVSVNPAEDVPATPTEYAVAINQRATKIIRDKLPKAGMKAQDAANGVKDFLLGQSGKKALKEISNAAFERILGQLEAGTPEETAKLIKGTK